MDFGADVMRHEAHDALAIRGRQTHSRVCQAGREPVEPEPSVRVQHDLDDCRIFQPGADRRAERRPQHARAAKRAFRPDLRGDHRDPVREADRLGGRTGR